MTAMATINGWRVPEEQVLMYKTILGSYGNAYLDQTACIHIEWDEWRILVDTDAGDIRIGTYKVTGDECAEEPTVWITIPESEQDMAVKILDGITEVI